MKKASTLGRKVQCVCFWSASLLHAGNFYIGENLQSAGLQSRIHSSYSVLCVCCRTVHLMQHRVCSHKSSPPHCALLDLPSEWQAHPLPLWIWVHSPLWLNHGLSIRDGWTSQFWFLPVSPNLVVHVSTWVWLKQKSPNENSLALLLIFNFLKATLSNTLIFAKQFLSECISVWYFHSYTQSILAKSCIAIFGAMQILKDSCVLVHASFWKVRIWQDRLQFLSHDSGVNHKCRDVHTNGNWRWDYGDHAG